MSDIRRRCCRRTLSAQFMCRARAYSKCHLTPIDDICHLVSVSVFLLQHKHPKRYQTVFLFSICFLCVFASLPPAPSLFLVARTIFTLFSYVYSSLSRFLSVFAMFIFHIGFIRHIPIPSHFHLIQVLL